MALCRLIGQVGNDCKSRLASLVGCCHRLPGMRHRTTRVLVAAALTCTCLSACSTSGGQGDCAFITKWRGVTYTDPMFHADGAGARSPHTAGQFLGIGETPPCGARGKAGTVRLFAIPGVQPRVAVTTEGAEYLGIAKGSPIPSQLIDPDWSTRHR
jgi:hypothetical protein